MHSRSSDRAARERRARAGRACIRGAASSTASASGAGAPASTGGSAGARQAPLTRAAARELRCAQAPACLGLVLDLPSARHWQPPVRRLSRTTGALSEVTSSACSSRSPSCAPRAADRARTPMDESLNSRSEDTSDGRCVACLPFWCQEHAAPSYPTLAPVMMRPDATFDEFEAVGDSAFAAVTLPSTSVPSYHQNVLVRFDANGAMTEIVPRSDSSTDYITSAGTWATIAGFDVPSQRNRPGNRAPGRVVAERRTSVVCASAGSVAAGCGGTVRRGSDRSGRVGRCGGPRDGEAGSEALLPAMRKELGDAIHRVVLESEEDVGEVDLGVDVVALAGRDE